MSGTKSVTLGPATLPASLPVSTCMLLGRNKATMTSRSLFCRVLQWVQLCRMPTETASGEVYAFEELLAQNEFEVMPL